ncbi:hypothetical protein D555_3842 [Bordetella holmesii 35009]|nr:hypothetical protein D555_3842 [Bordetella holmesii 35009]
MAAVAVKAAKAVAPARRIKRDFIAKLLKTGLSAKAVLRS